MEVTKLSSKGQIVLPAKLRSELHLSKGDKLLIEKKNDEILLKPISSLKRLRGVDDLKRISEELKKTRKRWDEEFEER